MKKRGDEEKREEKRREKKRMKMIDGWMKECFNFREPLLNMLTN